MRSQRASLMVALFVLATGRLFGVEVPNNRFYPQEAFLVTVTDRANLQTRLDFYGAIRLEKGDYLAGNSLTSLTIRSGNRIFGLGNDMPTMVVAPGTTDAIIKLFLVSPTSRPKKNPRKHRADVKPPIPTPGEPSSAIKARKPNISNTRGNQP